MTTTTTTIDHQVLRSFAIACFEASGVSTLDSEQAADVLLWASLRGVDTHGIRNLKGYYIDSAAGVGCRDGFIHVNAELTTDAESPSTAALNANGGMGLSISVKAMERAIEKARQHGVGVVTVRNSTHFGAAGCYAQMAADQDMIGFASTGYFFPNGQEKAVLPFGGLLPMLSTNPLAMAFPCHQQPPFVLDMATSVVPVNRIEMFEELGKSIPTGWAFNKDNEPTTESKDVCKVAPLGGAFEYGGHKGYGLALAGWILTGLLSGAWKNDPDPDRILGDSKEKKHGFAQEGIGHSFAAVRLDLFGDPEHFKRGMDAMIGALNDSPPAEGFDQVQVPGQIESDTMQERMRDGIPLPDSTVRSLRELSERFDIPLDL